MIWFFEYNHLIVKNYCDIYENVAVYISIIMSRQEKLPCVLICIFSVCLIFWIVALFLGDREDGYWKLTVWINLTACVLGVMNGILSLRRAKKK